MTDQRKVADIRKEHHDKYGTDITNYLIRTTETHRSYHQREQPISACEPENDYEEISSMRTETSTRDPGSIV